MLGMSISCVLCYFIFFSLFDLNNLSIEKNVVYSYLFCVFIELLGISLACFFDFIAFREWKSLRDFFMNQFTALFMALLGSIIAIPYTLGIGSFNIILLFSFRKSVKSNISQ